MKPATEFRLLRFFLYLVFFVSLFVFVFSGLFEAIGRERLDGRIAAARRLGDDLGGLLRERDELHLDHALGGLSAAVCLTVSAVGLAVTVRWNVRTGD